LNKVADQVVNFHEVIAVGFKIISQIISFLLFSPSLFTDTKIQKKDEFGIDSLIFPKVMALGLRKIS
jgi:hypothetical protein